MPKILRTLLHGAKTVGMVLLGWIIIAVEALGKLLSSLHIGDRLARSKLAARLGIKLSGKQIERILFIALCLILVIGLLSKCGADDKSGPSFSIGIDRKDCWACSGSGNCSDCGGSGKEYEWVGDQYMYLNCTSCSSTGNCFWCNGSGKE